VNIIRRRLQRDINELSHATGNGPKLSRSGLDIPLFVYTLYYSCSDAELLITKRENNFRSHLMAKYDLCQLLLCIIVWQWPHFIDQSCSR